MFRSRSFRRPVTVLAVGAVAAVALAACAGGGGSASSGASARSASDGSQFLTSDERAASGAKSGKSPNSSVGSVGSVGSVSPSALQASKDQLARRASIAITVKDIGRAVAKVRATTAAADGIVLSENIGASTGGIPLERGAQVSATTYGEITISVPATELDSVVDELGSLGTVIRSQSSSENVGAQIVDTESRLKTMRASVDRVRALMARATDLTQVVNLESELSRRQADLEALESQLAALKDSVATSPVQISLTTDPGVIADDAGSGFLAGLRGGWKAFTASVVVVLTVLGAVLPFALVAAVVAVPLWWVLRRRRAAKPEPQPQPVSAG
jgi:hypothetical protein